jgi:hypothetical protein
MEIIGQTIGFCNEVLRSSHLFKLVQHSTKTGRGLDMEELQPPARRATNQSQLESIAELPKRKKYTIFETLTEDFYEPYHRVSCFPITVKAEDDMVSSMKICTSDSIAYFP